MATFSPTTLLDAWDAGQGLYPIDRALLLLSLDGEHGGADLPLGSRNLRPMRLRQSRFGDLLSVWVDCPAFKAARFQRAISQVEEVVALAQEARAKLDARGRWTIAARRSRTRWEARRRTSGGDEALLIGRATPSVPELIRPARAWSGVTEAEGTWTIGRRS